jgi:hypothetical protein
MNDLWAVCANAVVSLAGIAAGGVIGFLSASTVSKLNARRQAGTAFRAAFAKEIALVRLAHGPDKSINPEIVLEEAFPRHAVAVEEYRFFVRPRERAAFDKAWRDYYEVGGSVKFYDYASMGSGGSLEKFENRIQALFSFTDK